MAEMFLVTAKKGCDFAEVEYEPEQGLDVLNYQLMSCFPMDADGIDFQLIDFAGGHYTTLFLIIDQNDSMHHLFVCPLLRCL